jgi:hypothetical protein
VPQRAIDGAVRRPPPQPRHVLSRAKDDMDRMVPRDLGACPVRGIQTPPRLLATRPVTRPAPGPWTQIELELRLAWAPSPASNRHLD